MARTNPDLSGSRQLLNKSRDEKREAQRKEIMEQNMRKRQEFLLKQGGKVGGK